MKRPEGESQGGGRRQSGMPIVRSVERSSRIVQAVIRAPEGMRVTDLSAELGLHKTTVVRLLRTLEWLGIVRRDERRNRYIWNPLAWTLTALELREPARAARVVGTMVDDLAERVGETVVVTVPDPTRRRMVAMASALPEGNPLRVDPEVLGSVPVQASGSGKAYLGALSDEELARLLRGGLLRATERTATDRERLAKELAQVRARGYGISQGEMAPGIGSVGVALRDDSGRPVAGLELVARLERLTAPNIEQWTKVLGPTGERVSAALYACGAEAVRRHTDRGERERGLQEEGVHRDYRVL